MEVLEKDGGIIFLRRLREGPTAESYGIHVARLAGLSPSVLERAQRIMSQLRERDANLREALPSVNLQAVKVNQGLASEPAAASVETAKKAAGVNVPANAADILRELHSLDPDRITPLEAIGLVSEWKRRLARGTGSSPVDAEKNTESSTKPKGGKLPDATPSLFD